MYQPNRMAAWREVVLTAHKPYPKGNCDGYEMHYVSGTETDKVTGVTPSQGGWTPTCCLKPIE
jgi:hypothetical protein